MLLEEQQQMREFTQIFSKTTAKTRAEAEDGSHLIYLHERVEEEAAP